MAITDIGTLHAQLLGSIYFVCHVAVVVDDNNDVTPTVASTDSVKQTFSATIWIQLSYVLIGVKKAEIEKTDYWKPEVSTNCRPYHDTNARTFTPLRRRPFRTETVFPPLQLTFLNVAKLDENKQRTRIVGAPQQESPPCLSDNNSLLCVWCEPPLVRFLCLPA